MLRDEVRREHRAVDEPGERRGVDDVRGPAGGLEPRQERADAVEHAPEVDAEHPLPVRQRLVGDASERRHPGVVAEDVDAAVALPDRVRERFHRLRIADVGDVTVRFGARRAQLADRAIERRALDVGEDDREAFLRRSGAPGRNRCPTRRR